MAERSYPFDIVVAGDRQVSAADHQTWIRMLLSSGVDPNIGGSLAITNPGGMFVQVAAGAGVIVNSDLGHMYRNTAALNKAVSTADPSDARIDIIVLDLDTGSDRELVALVVAGTPSGSPVAPTPTATQLLLATFDVAALATTPGTITDGRVFIVNPNDIPTFLVKSADETVNSSTVLQDDDDLTFSVDANGLYAVWGQLLISSPATPDFKFQWSLPASALIDGVTTHGVTGSITLDKFNEAASTALNNSTTEREFGMSALLQVAGSSGTAVLQWAQGTSDAGDTTLLKGSWLAFKKVA